MSLIPALVQELLKIFVGGTKRPLPPGRIWLRKQYFQFKSTGKTIIINRFQKVKASQVISIMTS